jgi:threonine synthase
METGQFDRQPSRTIADSISVDVPRNGRHALRLIQRHQGRIVTVADAAILQAQAHLAGTAGLFTEPAAAAAWAGFLKIKAELPPQAVIVVLLTGHGLKDTASAAKGVNVPEKVIRSLDDLEL